MKQSITIILLLLSLCFAVTGCYGKNYPGAVKSEYWVSEDETIMFYFPAEAGCGRAAGYVINGETEELSLLLEWDTRSGAVEVKTAGYEKVFTANTTTNATDLTCTFEITSQEAGYNFPSKIVFHWKQSID